MNAAPLLASIAQALDASGLEAILIGNAAAALHGAPVTTLDFDFLFRKTPTNMRKLKSFAKQLNAVILKPYYPASDLYRVVNDETGLQVDFMGAIHGVRSLASLRARAERVTFQGADLWIASLEDIITSKKAAGRPRDLAVLDILTRTLREKQNRQ